MRRPVPLLPLLPVALALSACGSLLGGAPPAPAGSLQIAVDTALLSRDVEGNVLVREANGRVTVTPFSFARGAGVQSRTVYEGTQGTDVDICVADKATGAKVGGAKFKLVGAPQLVLMGEQNGAVTLSPAGMTAQPSPRASCTSLE